MRFTILIVTTLFALNAKTQIVDRTLKDSGSLHLHEYNFGGDTNYVRWHDAPLIKKTKPPLVIVDGKRQSLTFASQLDINLIDSVYALKGKEAIEKYGHRARRGVIVVTTKKKQ